jgi:N-acetylneuraminate synthase
MFNWESGPCFIMAEAGVNHNGDLALARQLVAVAARAGADAVKFQTFSADRLVTQTAPQAAYQIANTGQTESQYAMLRRLELSAEAHQVLQAYCQELGILFLSTPFDEQSADLLDGLNVPAFKMASGEITNHPFLAHVARKGRPMIISTGMANLAEVETALEVVAQAGGPPVSLLHCTSNYPAPPDEINLRAMQTLRQAFNVPVGYSDHSQGLEISWAAVALGARIIEKHFTLDRNLPGPDHAASLEPDELGALVRGIRNIEAALGDGRKRPSPSEASTAAVARKSLVAARAIMAGEALGETMIHIKRPGTGLPPSALPYVLGRALKIDLAPGDLIRLEDLA